MKQAIITPKAPAAIGPYSQAIRSGDFIFISGQIPIDAQGQIPQGIEAQAGQVMNNLAGLLSAVYLTLDSVVKTTVYMTDLSQFEAMNAVYAKYFKPPYPARATLEVSALPRGALIEIEAIVAAN